MAPVAARHVRAVLLDVGGTLRPNRLEPLEPNEPAVRLASALGLDQAVAQALVERLALQEPSFRALATQDTIGLIRRTLDEVHCRADPDNVRRALCLPSAGRAEPFDGATELLRAIRESGRVAAIVSNTLWRDADSYWEDFASLGWTDLVAGIVTSCDVGYRKPHQAMFEAGANLVGSSLDGCVFVGDSEQNDIEPATSLGMATIRVAIEEPTPHHTVANAVATSLREVNALLQHWYDRPPAR